MLSSLSLENDDNHKEQPEQREEEDDDDVSVTLIAVEGYDLLKRKLSDQNLRRRLNLVAGKTLGQLRHDSALSGRPLHVDKDDDDDDDDDDNTPSLLLGKKLGQGGFSTVHVLAKNPSVAVKFLSDETLYIRETPRRELDIRQLEVACSDLVREAHFLATLSHPNIISFLGEGSLDDMASYYILLETIHTSMSTKMNDFTLATVPNGALMERLVYAIQIVHAMQYLHHRKIVYRDLKIDNIGLNASNQILLYDFGLAKELKINKNRNNNDGQDGKYKLTGNTGSWSYMAPEVAKGFRYNLSVDVFSFSVVLWELCSGEYARHKIKTQEDIVQREIRPPLVRHWPVALEDLMRDGWDWNPSKRPTFDQIEQRLNQIIHDEFPSKKGWLAFLWNHAGGRHAAAATSAASAVAMTTRDTLSLE